MDILEIYNKYNNFGRFLGMTYEVIEPGHVVHHLEVKKELLATKTAMHGGALAGFMDAVAGIPALTVALEQNRLVSTVEYKVSFLQPIFEGDVLRGVGKVVRKGNRIIVSQGEAYNQKGEMVAMAHGTFNSYPFEKSDLKDG